LIIPFVIALLIVACSPREGTGNVVLNDSKLDNAPVINDVTGTVNSTNGTIAQPSNASNATADRAAPKRYTVEGTEGELIELKPQAYDPDGDRLFYTFAKPFDGYGRWQTKIGDAGRYTVAIGVSDGKLTSTESVDVIVRRANRPPTISCKDVTLDEGEMIDLHKACSITDEEGDDVIVTYSGWMGSWRYQTAFGDAGSHIVTITASDKQNNQVLHTVAQNVTVNVRHVNRAPAFSGSFPTAITATENDVITLPKEMISDPDHDALTITFSAPFDQNGVWRTKLGDAGSYDVDVVANDGQTTTKRTVHVDVKMLNTPPVLKYIPDITVNEGDTVRIPISAYDREGDKLTTTISGWLTNDTYKTTYDDAGNYTVKVTVSDGVYNTTQIVHITVNDVNRAPVFVMPA
jgi:hypothetical protein